MYQHDSIRVPYYIHISIYLVTLVKGPVILQSRRATEGSATSLRIVTWVQDISEVG